MVNGLNKTINKLLDYSMSPYEFVDFVRSEKTFFLPHLRILLTKHASPYVRLCSAWALGDLRDKKSVPILKKAYKKEKEGNVRANIVWAIFRIEPSQIDLPLYKTFLLDSYFVIPLVALKRISGLFWLEGKINFLEYYYKFDNTLLKLEMLRNIRSFRFNRDINESLKNELYNVNDIYKIMGIIDAIGLTNQSSSADILMEYYSKNKNELLDNEPLTFHYISAMLSLTQSKGYESLHEIYIHSKSQLIKLKLIETLATVGGPKCLEALKDIYRTEKDPKIKNEIEKFINMIPITIN